MAVQREVGILRVEAEQVPPAGDHLAFGQHRLLDRHPVQVQQPVGLGPVGPVPRHRRGQRAVERRGPKHAGPRGTHPGRAERRRLLEPERGLAEVEPERGHPRIGLCGEGHGQPDEAAQGKQEP